MPKKTDLHTIDSPMGPLPQKCQGAAHHLLELFSGFGVARLMAYMPHMSHACRMHVACMPHASRIHIICQHASLTPFGLLKL